MRDRVRWLGVVPAILFCLSSQSMGETKALWSVTSFGGGDYFFEPSDIEVDGIRSRIYVADAGSCRVFVFDDRGAFLMAIGNKGQGPGEFSRPTGLCLLPGGALAVADFGSNRIQVFDAAGKFVRAVTAQEARVADVLFSEGRFYTVPSFGASGYAVTMDSEEKNQPLVNVLDEQGKKIAGISVADFPETQPFIRAIKHRVSLALSPGGKLFLPYFAANLVQVFQKSGAAAGAFTRPLPFKPMTPALVEQRSSKEGAVQMVAALDFVNIAAAFGPDGRLYILTATERRAEGRKEKAELPNPVPMRFDVLDPESRKVVETIPCDPGVRAFGLLDGRRLVYVNEDAEGELVLKCVRY